MRETLTDLLDALALLLLAAGAGTQVAGWAAVLLTGASGLDIALTGAGVFVAGLVVLAGSWYAGRPPRSEPG